MLIRNKTEDIGDIRESGQACHAEGGHFAGRKRALSPINSRQLNHQKGHRLVLVGICYGFEIAPSPAASIVTKTR